MFREFLSWLGCKINKILALLSIFVLTMLLSFAFGRTFTKEDIANFIVNSEDLTSNDPISTTVINNIKGQMAYWETLSGYSSTYEGAYCFGYSWYQHYFWFAYLTYSNPALKDYGMQIRNGFSQTINGVLRNPIYIFNQYNSSGNVMHLFKYDPINNIVTQSTGNGSWTTTTWNYSTTNFTNSLFYSDAKLGKGSGISYTSIPTTGSLFPSESIFDENYITSEKWEFNTGYTNTVHLFGNNTFDYHLIDDRGYIYTILGILQDSSLCTGAGYDIMAYNKSQDMWETVYDWGEYFTDSDPIGNYFTTGDIDGIPTSSIKLRSNLIIPDTIINFSFARGNSFEDLDKQIDISFYVAGSHTVYSGDSVDYDSTFSDPNYYNDYQYNVDGLVNMSFDDTLNDINDTLQNDNNVPAAINEYFGTSGEVLQRLGYNDYSGDNPYGNIFLTIIDGFRQVLLDDDNVVLSCTIHGQQFVFNSADFVNPSYVLRVFTTAFTIFITLYTFYFLAFVYLHKLAEGDLFGLRESVVKGALTIVRFM